MAIPRLSKLREIKFFNVPKTVNMSYSPSVVGNYAEREYLTASRSPRKTKIEHKLATRSKDILHWYFVAETSRSKLPLSVMRVHYRRRWSDAFGKALKNNGFDYRGRLMPIVPGQLKTAGLTGTLEIRLFFATHWEDSNPRGMQHVSNNIVRGLMEMQGVRAQKPMMIRKIYHGEDE